MKLMMQAAMIAGLLGAMAPSAMADCRKVINLNSTGVARDASGKAEVRQRGTRNKIKVEAEARVANGTRYNVFANGVLLGAVTINLGEGEIEVDTGDGGVLPPGATNVCAVTTVEVRDGAGLAVLTGSF